MNILNSIRWNNNLHDSIYNNICCSSLKICCVRSKLSSPREWIALYCFISISHTVWCLSEHYMPCHKFHSHILLALLWHLPAEKYCHIKLHFPHGSLLFTYSHDLKDMWIFLLTTSFYDVISFLSAAAWFFSTNFAECDVLTFLSI